MTSLLDLIIRFGGDVGQNNYANEKTRQGPEPPPGFVLRDHFARKDEQESGKRTHCRSCRYARKFWERASLQPQADDLGFSGRSPIRKRPLKLLEFQGAFRFCVQGWG